MKSVSREIGIKYQDEERNEYQEKSASSSKTKKEHQDENYLSVFSYLPPSEMLGEVGRYLSAS